MPELLSPAGNMESAFAAINAGADAIYVGGKNFSARNLAQNFSDEELENLIDYAALRGVKIYIAVNTLYKNAEIPLVLDFVCKMHVAGAAAFILQDTGLAFLLRQHLPDAELHASTQMTVHSMAGAKYMRCLGFSRVVLARELSLKEIAEIKSEADIELEVFVHGALCYSYSGQCLMSSLIGGRSGNRGKCAQICRTKYNLLADGEIKKTGYLCSPKDMNTLEILSEIVNAGATSLKIEGRMKSPEYVYLVTKAYREMLDTSFVSAEAQQNLLQIFNRGGSFSTGYYNTYASSDMMSTITPKSSGTKVGVVTNAKKGEIKFTAPLHPGDGIEIWTNDGNHVGTGISKEISAGSVVRFSIDGNISAGNLVYRSFNKKLAADTKKEMAAAARRQKVNCEVQAISGEKFCFNVSAQGAGVTTYGNIVGSAVNAPVTKEEILTQLSKTGNTPFELAFTSVNIGENIFISKGELNQLRRSALDALQQEILRNIKRPFAGGKLEPTQGKAAARQQKLTVQLSDIKHLPAVLEAGVARVYVPYSEEILALPKCDTEIFVTLPLISRNKTETETKALLPLLENSNIDGYLVSTWGQLELLKSLSTKKTIHLNHTFNIFNNWAMDAFADYGITLSQELNIHEIKEIPQQGFGGEQAPIEIELVVYGKQVLMSVHNCPVGLYGKCKEAGYGLRDKMGMEFPILTNCKHCVAHILNSKTLDTAPKFAALQSTNAASFRLIFTTENEAAICQTIARYKNAFDGKPVQRLEDTTYGHYFRGVE